MLDYIGSCFDNLVLKLLKIDISTEKLYAANRDKVDGEYHVLYEMSIIDSKSSALLTHVSVMLAVVIGMRFLAGDDTFYAFLLTSEIILYALVSMVLMRCVAVMGPPFRSINDDEHQNKEIYRTEILLRRGLYQLMLRTVIVLTAILILILIFQLFAML